MAPGDSNDANYLNKDLMAAAKYGGFYELKMVWPNIGTPSCAATNGKNYNHWKQTSNPFTEAKAGYEAIDVTYTASEFGGGLGPSESSADAWLDATSSGARSC